MEREHVVVDIGSYAWDKTAYTHTQISASALVKCEKKLHHYHQYQILGFDVVLYLCKMLMLGEAGQGC